TVRRGACLLALGPVASGLLGAAMLPLMSVAAFSTDGRGDANGVTWLKGIQGQATQLETGRVAERRPPDARKTFTLPFPGRDRGGEQPIELYKTERGGELILTDPAPGDLDTAREAGFLVGATARLAN